MFAAILDSENGGRFAITPSELYTGGQHYLKDSNVLETQFVTRTGASTLTDFMPFFRRPDLSWVAHGCIIRVLRCTSGTIPMRISYEPRLTTGARQRRCGNATASWSSRTRTMS